jgi:hypothetical protein
MPADQSTPDAASFNFVAQESTSGAHIDVVIAPPLYCQHRIKRAVFATNDALCKALPRASEAASQGMGIGSAELLSDGGRRFHRRSMCHGSWVHGSALIYCRMIHFFGLQSLSQVSAEMLLDVGCQWVILGHSERRKLYGETSAVVAAKIAAALQHKGSDGSSQLRVIACVGETLENRQAGCTMQVCSLWHIESSTARASLPGAGGA